MEEYKHLFLPEDMKGKIVTFFLGPYIHLDRLFPLVEREITSEKQFIFGPAGSDFIGKFPFVWVHPYKFQKPDVTVVTPQNLSGILHLTKEVISKKDGYPLCFIGDFIDTVMANVEFKPAYNFILSLKSLITVGGASAIFFVTTDLLPLDKLNIMRKFSDYTVDVNVLTDERDKMGIEINVIDIHSGKVHKCSVD